jgi:hypothetical protein
VRTRMPLPHRSFEFIESLPVGRQIPGGEHVNSNHWSRIVQHDPWVTVVCAPASLMKVALDHRHSPSACKPVEQMGVRPSWSESAVCRQSVFGSRLVCHTHDTIVARTHGLSAVVVARQWSSAQVSFAHEPTMNDGDVVEFRFNV